MERRRPLVRTSAGALVTLLVPLTAACGVPAAQGACISWVTLEDDAARTEAADIVVEGRALERVGERAMFGVDAAVWGVEVERVLKGAAEAGSVIDVASTPRSCEVAGAYPEGDPLDTDDLLRLYLTDSDFEVQDTEGGLALVTPFDGVAPAEEAAEAD